MEGYVRDGAGRLHPRVLCVEGLEERALLSFSAPFPPETAPAALPTNQGAVVSAVRNLFTSERAFLLDHIEAVLAGNPAGASAYAVNQEIDPDRDSALMDRGDRDGDESRRAAIQEILAACAADSRAEGEGETPSREVPSPVAAQETAAASRADSAEPRAVRGTEAPGGLVAAARGEDLPSDPAQAVLAPDVPGGGPGAGGEFAEPARLTPAEDPAGVSWPARTAAVLEGGLPFDLPLLKNEVDAFFARWAGLTEAGDGWPACTRFGPWLVVLTAGAFELARRWERKSSRRGVPGDEAVLGPAAFLTEEE